MIIAPERFDASAGNSALALRISYGTDIRKPNLLEKRCVQDLLLATRDGEWRREVEQVRSLPNDSSIQRAAKEKLPYVTWSGLFSRRGAQHLLLHSGLLAFDLDGIPEVQGRRIMHLALDDPHCLAAFSSSRGNGMRLILRVPAINEPEEHSEMFRQAAVHVRTCYGAGPDPSGSDVSRASFVSWDGGLWFNPHATPLSLTLLPPPTPCPVTTVSNHCGNSTTPSWIWLSRETLPFETKCDGSKTLYTHFVLLNLGRKIALRLHRDGIPLFDEIAEQVAEAWFSECSRRGLRLRGTLAEYRDELVQILRGARKGKWFAPAADKWTRWTREPDFPRDPKERLLFAITRHCMMENTIEFFLGWRDAGTITGLCHVRAGELLRELVAEGKILLVKKRRPSRHATTYLLASKSEGGVI